MSTDRVMGVFGALMVGSAILAYALTPHRQLHEPLPPAALETLIPERFENWQVDTSSTPIALPPELQDAQKKIYDEMLVRTYRRDSGERVMLTIAYGRNQSRSLQVHRPEVCYTALGFQISQEKNAYIAGAGEVRDIPVMQLVATRHTRNEPVTYWIRIGDQVVRGNLELGLARLSFGLRGYIPDGLLFRVSTVGPDNARGFAQQAHFVKALMSALNDHQRSQLIGMPSLPR